MGKKRIRTLLLVLLALLGLTAIARGAEAEPLRAVVLYEESADPAAVADAIARTEGAELLWNYDALFTGAAVEAAPETLSRLAELPGVADVRPARRYEAASAGKDNAVPSDEGLALMGADKLWKQGYTGDGTVIAVLDTGLLTTHEAFADTSLTTRPAISEADVKAFAEKGGTAGQYLSRRIPFAYDYFERDDDVSTTNGHGTHVTALAAGYVKDGFRGAAPGAQILSMKIFPNGASGGTDDTIVLRALEDAWNLGADVVNISISTGAGFVEDELMDGLYCKAFSQMAASGVVICCATGNESAVAAEKSWLPKLPSADYTDYGSACAPASYRGSVAVGAAALSDGKAVPADYSSWGPASGLHLTPALLAFGGPVASASVSGDSLYRSDYGTSMASPAASGLFASLIQGLRTRGVTDKAQAARLAKSLLESTAQILRDGNGLPVSPRKQGAGLVDLSAAANAELVVLDPLLELGESGEGTFTLSFTLRNLGKSALNASLNTTVLTDAYEQKNGTYYSTLTPRDITSGVTLEGEKSVTVPAGGEAAVTLKLTVGDALRQELSAVFTNGFYVEGFVTASAGSRSAHAAFLGYCGDWEAAPVLDDTDFRDVQDALFRIAERSASSGSKDVEDRNLWLAEAKADLGANTAFIAQNDSAPLEDGRLLGTNPRAFALHDDARLALPTQNTNAASTSGDWLRLDLYALRGAAGIAVLVTDQSTGTLYYADSESWRERTYVDTYDSSTVPAASFAWQGTDASGKPLPSGTKVRVDVYAWLDTDKDAVAAYGKNVRSDGTGEYRWLLEDAYAGYRELSFPLTLDGQAPTVSAARSGDGLTLTVQDDHCLAYAAAYSPKREALASQVFFPKAAGESGTLTVSGLPDTLYLQVEDYAGNVAGYALDVKGGGTPTRCAALLLKDADLSAWYHAAVDRVLEEGVMEADEDGAFRPGEAATRAEIVKALYQANGAPAPKMTAAALPFMDVSSRSSYASAVCWAYENELVTGQTATSFAGSAQVSRQQFAVMLWRCAKLNGTLGDAAGSLSAFPDRGRVAGWAQEAMTWAVGQGIINGQDGNLNPEGSVTRAQAAQMLVRFLER